MPAGIETFGNQPTASVTSGGTTTSDTSFVVTGSDSWPAASASVTPNTFFRFVDQANTSEIMIATAAAGGVPSSQTWTVLRGQEGTTAVTHSSPWTAVQLVSAGTLQNFKQASNAATTAVAVANTTTETILASYTPVGIDIEPGASFEAIAFGPFGKVLGGTLPTLTFNLRWGGVSGTSLCSLVTGTNAPAFLTTVTTGLTFDVNGTVTLIDSTHAHANLNLWYNNATSLSTTASNATISSTTSGGVVISGSGPLVLTAKWSAASASNTLTAVAPLIYRAA
jgi:hypothetical protein